ncbi:hypothetical protein BDA99DRAFT_560114 [Phascolomyces articulosus]|uniref:Uncharacterized protein n=1 Tax=Phascolomyces articulosus TaxID=60185 RepID=A0AAD5PDZ0_9FUNG|nr:hypothetical protein BDA99DRAFT_560114 [Phascolomyces articulosus]
MPFLKLTVLNHDTPLFCGHGFQGERLSLCVMMVLLSIFMPNETGSQLICTVSNQYIERLYL